MQQIASKPDKQQIAEAQYNEWQQNGAPHNQLCAPALTSHPVLRPAVDSAGVSLLLVSAAGKVRYAEVGCQQCIPATASSRLAGHDA